MRNRRFFLTMIAAGLTLTAVFGQPLRVTELPQQQLSVMPGQYSGIAWVSGDRYVVVDDKLPGGGIVFFDIPLQEDGTVRVGRVRRTVPEATTAAGVTGLDNEGMVYADGFFYVSAESDQSIREYDLDGTATGRTFSVPDDMGAAAIMRNGGFEALAWNKDRPEDADSRVCEGSFARRRSNLIFFEDFSNLSPAVCVI